MLDRPGIPKCMTDLHPIGYLPLPPPLNTIDDPLDLFAHHKIEETHLFPILAKKMPAFQNDDEHLKSHHDIHEGTEFLFFHVPDLKSYSTALDTRTRT